MSTVKIPFRPYFSTPMRDGVKVMTCRSKRMASPGDTFDAFGLTFRVTHVFRCRLGYVVSDAYKQEGCASEHDLIAIWESIHPANGYDPESIVWAHCFIKEQP